MQHSGNGSLAYGMTPEQASREFDSLRREATKLERHLEDKVAKYQQLAQRLTTGDGGGGGGGKSSSASSSDPYSRGGSLLDRAEAGSASSTNNNNNNNGSNKDADEEESLLSRDVRRAMAAMTDLVEARMAPAAERTGRPQHSLLVKRYREVLFDCGAVHGRTAEAVARRREARDLFRGAADDNFGGQGNDDGTEQLLRERNAIENSMQSAAGVLSQAAGVRSELRSQGAGLRGVSGTMASIASNVPGLNGLIDRIRKKRQQDDRVVVGVVATCILFTLWYVLG